MATGFEVVVFGALVGSTMLGLESLASLEGVRRSGGGRGASIVLGVVEAVVAAADTLSTAAVFSPPACGAEAEEAPVVFEEFTDALVGVVDAALVGILVVVLVGVEELAETASLFAEEIVVGDSAFATTGAGQR